MTGYQRYVRDSVKTDMYVQSGSSSAAVPPSVDDEEEEGEEPTAEASSMEVDSPKSATTAVSRLSPSSILRRGGSSTSLSSLKSIRSNKTSEMVPRGDLFKVHVADASASEGKSGVINNIFKSKDVTVQPFFKGSPSHAAEKLSPLENRMKIKKGMFGRITSMMSSSNTESETETDSSPSTPNSPQPVIRPGEGIFVEWTVKKFNEYFDLSSQPEVIDDPAIEIENKKKKEGKVIGIEDCLDEFSKEETLGQDDLWYCPVVSLHRRRHRM
jgi:ubiquitin carboxyl-terminal hydrolase 4/11/15